MDIHAEKNLLIKMILETDDISLLNKVKLFFASSNKKDFWHELTKEQKAEIEAGIEDIDNGKFVDYNSFMLKHK